MTTHKETRLAVGRGRASDLMLGGSTSEVAHNLPIFNYQAAAIARRFVVSESLARAIAEHAYAARPAR